MKVSIKKCEKLRGTIKITGSKNSVLPILAISLLTKKKMTLTNVPMISDVYNMLHLLRHLGVKIKLNFDKNTVILKRKKIKNELLCDEVNKIRASYYLYPGLIHNNKESYSHFPGGCNFTDRPINYHLDIFRQTGVKIEIKDQIRFSKTKLKGANFEFSTPSVGATINAILHTVLIKGKSVIKNQPIEPEIKDVISCLNKMGANIKIEDNNIIIKGTRKLKKVKYEIMPDRIELGSYLLLASVIPSQITFTNTLDESIEYLRPYLNKLNINYIYNNNKILLDTSGKINGLNLEIMPYPSFPTDLQPILCAALLASSQESTIIDKVYPKRISHLHEMRKMEGNLKYSDGKIIIKPSVLKGTCVTAHDLRCGFGLILCACLGQGTTYINNFEVINRGYENIISKLKAIGVQINEV